MLKRLFLVFSFWLLPSFCWANYVITEGELTVLENNLEQLRVLGNQSEQELRTVNLQLRASKKELATSNKELIRLQTQLNELKATNERQQVSLVKANQSLQEYAAEEKRKRRVLKWQRNSAWAVALAAVAVAIAK